jgi:hypothetical protein
MSTTPQKQAEDQKKPATKDGVEGEGSYTAARRYREGVEHTVEEGHVKEHAEQAKQAIDGPEGESLRRAEQAGKRGKAVKH